MLLKPTVCKIIILSALITAIGSHTIHRRHERSPESEDNGWLKPGVNCTRNACKEASKEGY